MSFSVVGAAFASLAVAGGAFGAHSLKRVLSADMLAVFETAVRYQMYHALALLLVGESRHRAPANVWWNRAGWSFVVGIGLFSGSLFALAFTELRWCGAVTPVGGLAFLLGWVFLAVGHFTQR